MDPRVSPARAARARRVRAQVGARRALAPLVGLVAVLRLPAPVAATPGVFTTKADLKAAVDDHPASEAFHGPVSGWDVSASTICTEFST